MLSVGQSLYFFAKGSGPFAATVASVNEDGTVNISRLDAEGDQFPQASVPFWDGEEPAPEVYVALPKPAEEPVAVVDPATP